MGQGKKSRGAVTKWCTEREWPVNCMTVISARWRSNMPFQRRWKLRIPLASYGKRLRRRAWLTIWDRVKIPRYSHKVMHWKRVTCELHDSYFRSMTIKHAIPKTAEMHIPLASYGKRSRGRGGVSIPPRGSLMVI